MTRIRAYLAVALLLAAALPARATAEAIVLKARDAAIKGGARYVASTDNIGYWQDANAVVSWTATVARAGTYRVLVTLACPPADAGSAYEIRIGSQRVNGFVPNTGSWTVYKEYDLGPVLLRRPGDVRIEIFATRKVGSTMNLRAIRLVREPD